MMGRLIVLVVLTALVVAFGVANGNHVPLSLVVGQPLLVRQIFLLLSATAVGIVGTLVVQQYLKIAARREREQIRLAMRSGKAMRRRRNEQELGDVIDVSVGSRESRRRRKKKIARELTEGRPRRPATALRRAKVAPAPKSLRAPKRSVLADIDEAEQ